MILQCIQRTTLEICCMCRRQRQESNFGSAELHPSFYTQRHLTEAQEITETRLSKFRRIRQSNTRRRVPPCRLSRRQFDTTTVSARSVLYTFPLLKDGNWRSNIESHSCKEYQLGESDGDTGNALTSAINTRSRVSTPDNNGHTKLTKSLHDKNAKINY